MIGHTDLAPSERVLPAIFAIALRAIMAIVATGIFIMVPGKTATGGNVPARPPRRMGTGTLNRVTIS
jgi:hypothetical protein